MPSNLINSYAEKTGLSVEEVEKKWNQAKETVKKQYKDINETSDKYYALTVSIFKKMLKMKNEEMTATTNSTSMGKDAIYAPKIGTPMNRLHKRINKKIYEEGTILEALDILLENTEN